MNFRENFSYRDSPPPKECPDFQVNEDLRFRFATSTDEDDNVMKDCRSSSISPVQTPSASPSPPLPESSLVYNEDGSYRDLPPIVRLSIGSHIISEPNELAKLANDSNAPPTLIHPKTERSLVIRSKSETLPKRPPRSKSKTKFSPLSQTPNNTNGIDRFPTHRSSESNDSSLSLGTRRKFSRNKRHNSFLRRTISGSLAFRFADHEDTSDDHSDPTLNATRHSKNKKRFWVKNYVSLYQNCII